jgi:hypothetical protein
MPQRVYVSANRRFLVTADGKPFFWLGDTAWELFHRLSREEAEHYLENRRQKGINVIQAVALAEIDGLRAPNAYGEVPLDDFDPAKPREAYFHHVDWVIERAAEKGLYIGLLPTWGDKVHALWGAGPRIFNPANAYEYGRWLATRYAAQENIIWILGGDRPEVADDVDVAPVVRAMAAGVRSVLGYHALMTYHPPGGRGSSASFHYDDWLDINMWQSGHLAPDMPNWDLIAFDYERVPPKPVLDGEPNYEDHPIDPFTRRWQPEYGYFNDYDVRKQAYRGVFAGACGHTYGHHSVWQFYSDQFQPLNFPYCTWQEALDRPGASQLIHLRRLMESRPYLVRVPDQSILASDPGQRGEHVQATRGADGSYALVYIPNARQTVEVKLQKFSGPAVRAWWYDPRTGAAKEAGTYPVGSTQSFTTPAEGPDWVLVLDDATRQFARPGTRE